MEGLSRSDAIIAGLCLSFLLGLGAYAFLIGRFRKDLLRRSVDRLRRRVFTIYHVTGRYVKNGNEIYGTPTQETYLCTALKITGLDLRISTYDSYHNDSFFNRHLITLRSESLERAGIEYSIKSNQPSLIEKHLTLIQQILSMIDLEYTLHLSNERLCILRKGTRAFYEFDVLFKIFDAYEPLWDIFRAREA